MTLALYGKTKRRQAGLLLGGLLAVILAIAGGLVLRSDTTASALTLGSANGTWVSVTGDPPNFSGAGTSRIYWGNSTGSGQSSYLWQSGPAVTFTPGQDFLLGGFTHFNNPITGGSITSATLSLPLAFTDPVTTRTVTVVFNHDETNNNRFDWPGNNCPYGPAGYTGVNENGCADRVQLPTLGADQHFQVGDNLYTLTFTGFHPVDAGAACPTNDPGTGEVTTFLTKEEAENKGCIYAQLTFVAPVVDVAKAAVASPINQGEDAKFKITVTNASEAEAHGWSLTDTLPAGFTWSKESGPAACNVTANVLTCTDLTVPAGTVAVPGKVEIVVKASTVGAACGPITNPLVTISKEGVTPNETAGPATVNVINCLRTIRVVKVTDTADHPGGTFTGSISPGGADTANQTWSQALAADAADTNPGESNSTSQTEQTVSEATPPANWSNAGFAVVADTGAAPYECTGDETYAAGPAVVPAGATNYVVCVKNNYTPPTRTIEVCKVVVDNSDGTVDGGLFGFSLFWDKTPHGGIFIGSTFAGPHPYEGDPLPTCTSFDAPTGATVQIVEVPARPGNPGVPGSWNGDDPLYPQNNYDGLGSKDSSVSLPPGVNSVTFYNKTLPRTKQIVIEKYFLNLGGYVPVEADIPGFDLDPSAGTSCAAPVKVDNDTWTITCTVPYAWDGTVKETPRTGWRKVVGPCPPSTNPEGVKHYAFCNEPVGTLRIEKADGVNGAAGPAWEFTVSGGGYSGANPTADQGTPFEAEVALSSTPIVVNELASRSLSQCAAANTYYTIASAPSDPVIDAPGDVRTWTFQNIPCGIFGTGGLVIEKYLDINGDGDANDAGEGPLDGWEFTTHSLIPPERQVRLTAGGGKILEYVSGFDAGTVLTTTESPQTGYTLIRVTLDGVNVGANATNEVVVIGGQTRVIRYYNQPRGSITVQKETYRDIAGGRERMYDDDDGWKITLSSAACGLTYTGVTGADGTVTFTGLLLCNDWVATEDLASPGAFGYVPESAASVAGLTPGRLSATQVKFVNVVFLGTPPTPTPVPPTATPVPPTATPVPPTNTPQPTSTVLGERTPGPVEPTPIAPSTGDSGGNGPIGTNLALFVAGLTALAAGLGVTVLAGRRRQ